MRNKIVFLGLLAGLLVLTGCNQNIDSSNSGSIDSSETSQPSVSTPTGTPHITLVSDDHIKLVGGDTANEAGYYQFSLNIEPGYQVGSLTAVGATSKKQYSIAGSGTKRNIVVTDEDVIITVTSVTEASLQMPDEVLNGLLELTKDNKRINYSFIGMNSQGMGFMTQMTNVYGDNISTRNIGGSMFGSATLVKDTKGDVAFATYNPLTNTEIFDDQIFTAGAVSWDDAYVLTKNPFYYLGSTESVTGGTPSELSTDRLKEIFSYTAIDNDSVMSYNLTLKPAYLDQATNVFLMTFLQSDMALGSYFLSNDTTLASLSVTLDQYYGISQVYISFTGTFQYDGTLGSGIISVTSVNDATEEELTDPCAPRTDDSASDIMTAHNGIMNELAEGNYTLTITPDPETEDTNQDGVGWDGQPNGCTGSNKAAPVTTIYSDGSTIASDAVSNLDNDSLRYVIKKASEGNGASVYGVTTDNTVTEKTTLGKGNGNAAPAFTDWSDYNFGLNQFNSKAFVKNSDGTYSLTLGAEGTLGFSIMDSYVCDYGLNALDTRFGPASVIWTSGDYYMGITGADLTLSDDTVTVKYSFALTSLATTGKTYHTAVTYEYTNIGSTSFENTSVASNVAAVNAYIAA